MIPRALAVLRLMTAQTSSAADGSRLDSRRPGFFYVGGECSPPARLLGHSSWTPRFNIGTFPQKSTAMLLGREVGDPFPDGVDIVVGVPNTKSACTCALVMAAKRCQTRWDQARTERDSAISN